MAYRQTTYLLQPHEHAEQKEPNDEISKCLGKEVCNPSLKYEVL